MFSQLLNSIIFFALHFERSNIFPPPLSSVEEKELLIRLSSGDEKAKEKLVQHNLRLVAHIIKKYNSQSEDNDELISVGTVGLIKAINTFNYNKGTRLATYASRCIENEILMYFRNRKKYSLDISFEEPIETDNEGNPLTLMDIVSQEDTVLDELTNISDIKKLKKYISEIPDEREKSIIIMRYGLNGQKPKTQNELAALYGISRSYVSRIESKIIKKLRKRFDTEKEDLY